MILAKSGKAAVNVRGMTIQSALSIDFDTMKFKEITAQIKATKIKQLQEIEYICIDEISLVDKGLFAQIDKRLREIKQRPKIPFGNVNIIILGDWAQLFPVGKDPLFFPDRKKDKGLIIDGKKLYETFKDCINLTEIMRQNYTEPDRNIHTDEEFELHSNQKG